MRARQTWGLLLQRGTTNVDFSRRSAAMGSTAAPEPICCGKRTILNCSGWAPAPSSRAAAGGICTATGTDLDVQPAVQRRIGQALDLDAKALRLFGPVHQLDPVDVFDPAVLDLPGQRAAIANDVGLEG